jgi:beta-N-acetylhexosaminidase
MSAADPGVAAGLSAQMAERLARRPPTRQGRGMTRAVRHAVAAGVAAALGMSAAVVPATTPVASAATPADTAAAAYKRMTAGQRVGQLFMGFVPGTGSTAAARQLLARYHVGNVVLIGQSTAGVTATANRLVAVRRATSQAKVHPFIAVDQEGGLVQHLKGTGFSTIPTALKQGTIAPTTLRADWRTWAGQLRRAGVNLDLAPVADVVPASVGTSNQPIGRFYREYGHRPSVVSSHVAPVITGIRRAGIWSTVKHFPGLGRATGNTDTTVGVTDPTTSHDAYLAPFQHAIDTGAPVVMLSTAIYPHIDPGVIGAFSHTIVTGLLRQQMGFSGLIVSDSLTAKSVTPYTYATRAIRSLDAGIDVLLLSSNAPVKAMTYAIRHRMSTHPTFRSVVKTAVLRVLTAKAKAGLITG